MAGTMPGYDEKRITSIDDRLLNGIPVGLNGGAYVAAGFFFAAADPPSSAMA